MEPKIKSDLEHEQHFISIEPETFISGVFLISLFFHSLIFNSSTELHDNANHVRVLNLDEDVEKNKGQF